MKNFVLILFLSLNISACAKDDGSSTQETANAADVNVKIQGLWQNSQIRPQNSGRDDTYLKLNRNGTFRAVTISYDYRLAPVKIKYTEIEGTFIYEGGRITSTYSIDECPGVRTSVSTVDDSQISSGRIIVNTTEYVGGYGPEAYFNIPPGANKVSACN